MNTISSTFDENLCNCTVLGGREKINNARYPVTVLMLNRNSSNFKEQSFDSLLKCGFESIISVENPKDNYKIEGFSRKYPEVSFLLPERPLTTGEMINLGMSICTSENLLVIWDDITIKAPLFTDLILSKFAESDSLCFSPVLTNSMLQNVPVRMKPEISRFSFNVLPQQVIYDCSPTAFPYDFIGIYNKQKFISVGGFDSSLRSPYWQLMDFALRSWLWGEKLTVCSLFRFSYMNNEPIYDVTVDDSYFRFFLKNIAISVKLDHGYLPIRTFVTFHRNSNYSFGPAITEFRLVRKWVYNNKYRFKIDIKNLVENWDKEK